MAVRKPLLRDIEVHPDFKKRTQKIFQKFQKFYFEKSEQDVSQVLNNWYTNSRGKLMKILYEFDNKKFDKFWYCKTDFRGVSAARG